MAKGNEIVKKSLLTNSQKKIFLIVFELFLILCAILFLFPVFLTIFNSFKSNSEILKNPLSIPRFSKKLQDKIKVENFENNLLNLILIDEDKYFIRSQYNQVDKYFILNNNIGKEDYDRIIEIIEKNGINKTIFQNIRDNYIGAWNYGNIPVKINGKTKKNFVTFPQVFLNTIIITIFSVAGIVLISSMASYALVRINNKLSWGIFLFFTFSMVVPFQAIMIPLVETAKILGVKNSIPGIVLIYMGVGSPLAIFMYHGFIKGIPKELEESAAIDGAGPFTIFFKIVFPLLTPITATIVILDVLWIWNDFLLPLIILQSKELKTIQLAQYSFFGAYKREYGLALASLVISASPIVVFYLFMQKYIIKGITSGAVKG